jgi:hypothetical protein
VPRCALFVLQIYDIGKADGAGLVLSPIRHIDALLNDMDRAVSAW